jgi:hypothetical protein
VHASRTGVMEKWKKQGEDACQVIGLPLHAPPLVLVSYVASSYARLV